MLWRFTEAARQVVVLAQEDARVLGHARIGTGHILRGLLLQENGVAAHVLGSLGVTLARARAHALRDRGSGGRPAQAPVEVTSGAERVLEHALRETQGFVDTEHILVALLREPSSTAVRILDALGVASWKVHRQLVIAPSGGEVHEFPTYELPSRELPGTDRRRHHQHLAALERADLVRLARARLRRR